MYIYIYNERYKHNIATNSFKCVFITNLEVTQYGTPI